MATDPKPPNKPVIDDNVRRTAERTALRKVRGVLDALEREEQEDRRFRLGIYAVCGRPGPFADLDRRSSGSTLRIGGSPAD
jgi:hypothetical protein